MIGEAKFKNETYCHSDFASTFEACPNIATEHVSVEIYGRNIVKLSAKMS